MSAQGGGVLARRSSMNQPKPPPPVRRSSSITSAANPALLQKYRTSPPKQLPPPQTQSQTNAQPPSHRRSSSSSGTPAGAEPAYAELQEIQQSIQARQQQQRQQQQQQVQGYNSEGYTWGQAGQGAVPSQSPQYAEPVTIVNANTVNSLDAKFSSMNMTQTQQVTNTSVSHTHPVSSTGFMPQTAGAGSGDDFPDLPPPPTDEELREIEKIYSVPKNVNQTPFHNVQTRNNVQIRPQQQQQNPVGGVGMDFRQSLISEMKAGNKFRKLSQSDQGAESEC